MCTFISFSEKFQAIKGYVIGSIFITYKAKIAFLYEKHKYV